MRIVAPRQREADAIATLVALAQDGWQESDMDVAASAALIAAEWLRRTGLTPRAMRAPAVVRRRPAWSTEADYREAREHVLDRSGGKCEVQATGCFGWANNVHHRAGRGFDGCHHPSLLVAVCGNGNVDGCHGKLHQSHPDTEAYRLPWGTTADTIAPESGF